MEGEMERRTRQHWHWHFPPSLNLYCHKRLHLLYLLTIGKEPLDTFLCGRDIVSSR